MPNISPWIIQLKRNLPEKHITENKTADVAIVGGGIAGISTAYFILKNSDKSVILLEGDKIAHGATGHNAGQIVSYFERQLSDLVSEYGLEKAADAQKSVNSAWILLEQIMLETGIKTPLSQFTGYAGCQDLDEILVHLDNNWHSREAALPMEPLIIAKESTVLEHIPHKYEGLYSIVPHIDVLSLLETEDTKYIAVLSAKKGCMNSALFCEEVLKYMVEKYADRFEYFEKSHVKVVALQSDKANLKIGDHHVLADKVVLCTNGFENFTITNQSGKNIDTQFHHLVRGSVGYMAAFLEKHITTPVAISYLPNRSAMSEEAFDTEPYFYLTRRTFEIEENQKDSLVCIGGPEVLMDDTNGYRREHPYPQEAQRTIDTFLHKTYKYAPKGEIDYLYKWHGLMGYTPNGLRCIGPEPINPVLLYNLGCNGVGILPSIYGGKKISQFINGESLVSSIFDPLDSREKKQIPSPPLPFSLKRSWGALSKHLFPAWMRNDRKWRIEE